MTAVKPSSNEEEYFAKIEAEKKRKLAKETRAKLKEEEKKHLKELHYMHCSKCGMELHQFVFKGVVLDKCYNCGAVVLDHDEFEKLAGEEEHLISSIVGIFK